MTLTNGELPPVDVWTIDISPIDFRNIPNNDREGNTFVVPGLPSVPAVGSLGLFALTVVLVVVSGSRHLRTRRY